MTGEFDPSRNFYGGKEVYFQELGLTDQDFMKFKNRNLSFYREARKELRALGMTVSVSGTDGDYMYWRIGIRR